MRLSAKGLTLLSFFGASLSHAQSLLPDPSNPNEIQNALAAPTEADPQNSAATTVADPAPGIAPDLPAALKEERYEVNPSGGAPDIQSQALESDYPEPPVETTPVDEDDFLFVAKKKVTGLLVSNVGVQEKYRPTHRFGIWTSYSSSVLSKALFRSSTDTGLIDNMRDTGLGLGIQMDFSWVENPLSPQPSNSSLRVRAGMVRSKIDAEPAFLLSGDPATIESAMNLFHAAFLLKNALPMVEGVNTWAGGGVFLNYVLWTSHPRLQSDPSSNILNSLAFGPIMSLGADFEVGTESELLLEVDYHLFKSWGAQLGLKTSL